MYKNILVAVDLSEISNHAAQKAVQLANFSKSNVHVCYVFKSQEIFAQTAYTYAINLDLQDKLIKPLQDEFQKFCNGLSISTEHQHFVEGTPKEEILKLAQSLSADLIVLGGHSHSWIGMLGSVANAVVNQAKCDVLVVNDFKP